MTRRLDPSLIPSAPDLAFESALWQADCGWIAGLDEAGRGAWAGPVVAGVVVLPHSMETQQFLSGVRDSKQISPQQRAVLAPLVKEVAVCWAVGFADASEIDRYGIVASTRLAMRRALENLSLVPDHLLIDALFLPEIATGQTSLIKGDQRSLSIAAASIIAKTTRDAWMVDCEQRYPQFAFARHKGYGTSLHQERLAIYGPCPIHRQSFDPIHQLILQNTKMTT